MQLQLAASTVDGSSCNVIDVMHACCDACILCKHYACALYGIIIKEVKCNTINIIGASLSEPHLVRSVAGSANRVCINCGPSTWATE